MLPNETNSFTAKRHWKKKVLIPTLLVFPCLLGAYNGAYAVKGKYHWSSVLIEPAIKEAHYQKLVLNVDDNIMVNSYANVTYGGKKTRTTIVPPRTFVSKGNVYEKSIYIPEAINEKEELEISYDTLFAYSNNVNDYAGNLFSFTLKRVRPRLLTYKDFPFSRKDNDGTCAIYVEEKHYDYYVSERFYSFDGKGFSDEYECDRSGAIPLWNMQFIQTGYLGEFEPMNPKKAELRIYDYVDDFHLGYVFTDVNKQKHRSIPLGVETSPVGYSYLVSKNYLSTRTDLRYQTSEGKKGETWFQTRTIYLPPNKDLSVRAYRCKIILEGVGEMRQDSFEHDFILYRYANYIGGKANSEYYVTEVDA